MDIVDATVFELLQLCDILRWWEFRTKQIDLADQCWLLFMRLGGVAFR